MEMSEELLALLTPEEREAWEISQKATPGPWDTNEYGGIGTGKLAIEKVIIESSGFEADATADDILFITTSRTALPAALVALAELRRELKQWTQWGVVEVAVRNPQVAEYCDHWEKRTEAAERKVQEANERIAELETEVELGRGIEKTLQESLKAAEARNAELEEQLKRIAEVVSRTPTVTGLQEGCVKDHSLIVMAIADMQDTFKDMLKRPEAAQPEQGQEYPSRSIQRRVAAQKGLPTPTFGAGSNKPEQPAPSAGTQERHVAELQQLPEDLWRCIGANPSTCKDFRCPIHGVMQPAPRGTARELAQEIAEWVNSGGPLDALEVKHLELRLEAYASQAAPPTKVNLELRQHNAGADDVKPYTFPTGNQPKEGVMPTDSRAFGIQPEAGTPATVASPEVAGLAAEDRIGCSCDVDHPCLKHAAEEQEQAIGRLAAPLPDAETLARKAYFIDYPNGDWDANKAMWTAFAVAMLAALRKGK